MKKKLRDSISATGSFVSIPEAFPGAHPAIVNAIKIELQTARAKVKQKSEFHPVLLPNTLLVDLLAVDVSGFEPKKLIRDCEILAAALSKHPDKLKIILEAFGEGVPPSRIAAASKIVDELGLDEVSVSKQGGGLVGLLVMLALVILVKACDSCDSPKKKDNRQ